MASGTLQLAGNHRRRISRFDPRQGVLNLITGDSANDSDLYGLQKKIFWTLGILSVFLIILYVYLINSAILNAVKQNDVRDSIASLQTNLLNLEYSYLEKAASINLSLAYEKGFKDAQNPHFLGVEKRDTLLSVRDSSRAQ